MRSRRCTATLTLVLIGAAALPGCDSGEEMATRDVYASRADCQRDWGSEEKACERQSSGTHSGYWYGPGYSRGSYSGSAAQTGGAFPARQGSSAIGTTHVARGGFGSSAGFHSSGG
jgi:hypothetical protein